MVLGLSANLSYVIVAFITGLPAIVSAVGVILVHRQNRTPSGKSIGKQTEDVLHTVLANNYRLRTIGHAVKAEPSPESHAEAQSVTSLPEGNGKD